ncbi:MAG: hypothetical protein WCL00_16500, partial [Bacteroidota bacterium]
MQNNHKYRRFQVRSIVILMIALAFVQFSCKKGTDNATTLPTKFTDLQIDPSFKFDSYITLDLTVDVAGVTTLTLIQVYQGDPAQGGKLLTTGSVNSGTQFKTSLRIPASLKEIWLGKITATGNNEYLATPVTGPTLHYTFGSNNKEVLTDECNTGTSITNNGSYTVNSGQTYVVHQGVNISNLGLHINTGGVVRVCGIANITS